MRKWFSLTLILFLVLPVAAQQRTGNIYGKVVDTDGNPLPGVTVTLTGSLTAPISVITSAEGVFRFLSLAPGRDYKVTAELEGFKTVTRENIIVSLGRNTEITLAMEMGTLEEEVTVIAATPVVETKRTTVAENITRDVLQSLPTSRDPWVILQQAPGVMVDRENVGGSESGQMAGFYSKGGGSEMWSIDGASIEDPSSVSSITYFDFDAFEEMNVTLGGGDVTVATGGVNVNMVTRRGGNNVSLGGRFYLTDQKFQADNLTDELRAEGVQGTNIIRNIKDYGFNTGGPFFKDKAWWWLSYGVQDIKSNNIYGNPDDTLLANYAAKINLQLVPQNRFEAFVHIGNKEKFGRSASYSFPRGWHQTGKYHFGTPIIKVEDEHMFGDNLFVSAKYSYSGGGFNMIPTDDEEMQQLMRYDVTAGIYRNSYWFYRADRPTHNFRLMASYFNDKLFGVSHEVKIGVEYRHSTGAHEWRTPGNVYTEYNYNYPTVDITGDNIPDLVDNIEWIYVERGWRDNNTVTEYVGFFSDTITVGRLNAILGFRYSHQHPRIGSFTMTAVEKDNGAWTNNFTTTAINAIDSLLPGLNIPTVDPDYAWKVFSPRLGLTYDLFGDGKTIVKLSLGQYGEFMGTDEAGYFEPLGLSGWSSFYWLDNGDGIVDATELFWRTASAYSLHPVFDANGNFIGDVNGAYGIMWEGYDFDNPQQTGAPRYTLDSSAGSPRISEAILSLERELLPDLGLGVHFTYRRFDHFNWNLAYDPATGDKASQDEYFQAGVIPEKVGPYSTGEAAGKPYYLLKGDIPYRWYQYREQRPDYYRDFKGVDFVLNKRLSNNWMLNLSFTLQDQREHYGDKGYLNPTNLWALDNITWAPQMGGSSGKIGMYVFSRWLFKLSGLYQLPLDFNLSFTFNAREGHIIPHTVDIVDYNAPNPYSQTINVYLDKFGTERLPTFYNLNLRIEKIVRYSDSGRIYFMADIFNVFNSAIMNRRYDRHHGTYYVHNGYFAQNATDFMANEILNPRVVRFGVRFQF